MGSRFNSLNEPIFTAVAKPLLTEFGIHLRLESCAEHSPGWSLLVRHKLESYLPTFLSPRNGIRDSRRRSWDHFKFVRLLSDVFLKDFAVGSLRVPEVHHLVQEFVDYHEVVPQRLFFDIPEIAIN